MRVRVASAGTGKTTSLVRRYLELIGSGTPLRRVAGVTFTRAAADELRGRVGEGVRALLRDGTYLDGLYDLRAADRPRFEEALLELEGATLTTIHGFMIAGLRLAAPTLGLDPAFRLVGEWEAEAMFEEEVKSLRFLAADPAHDLHGAVAELGDDLEGWLLALFRQRSLRERFVPDDHPRAHALERLFAAAYRRFELRLGAGRLAPSEVERRALRLVRTEPALARLRDRYRLALVDEFQDVNPLQGEFFEALERGGVAIEVVGDPKQSIYGFRHADVGVFRRALAEGEELEPLTDTRRHATVLARFLNRLTCTLAEEGWGFGPREAPAVESAGAQAEVQGRVEVLWAAGDEPIGALRAREAEALAGRLRALHDEGGYAWHDMAVLARSHVSLQAAEAALTRAGVPAVFVQGRGYFDRLEIRDLYHALRVAVDPRGRSLAAWLRSPFAQLPLDEASAVLAAEDPVARLAELRPEVHARLERMRGAALGSPLAALKFLIRDPFLDGRRYVDHLEDRARENVDALLFTVAQGPPGDLEVLLDRLDLLSRQRDAGDVPQSGDGVQLLTVHRSKGLEWPVVAVFDLGRMPWHPPQPLYLHPEDGALCVGGSPRFEEAREATKAREEDEGYRLLYVAASRPRDVLVLTGSVKGGKPDGWAKALAAMGMGPGAGPFDRAELLLRTVGLDGGAALAPAAVGGSGRAAARPAPSAPPWLDRRFALHPHPPVHSPSRLEGDDASPEPLPPRDPDEGERLPGRATTVGTLVHYAISQDWSEATPQQLDNLRAQEVMFPYAVDEQDAILAEVRSLLASYRALLGTALPAVAERDEDHRELPMALPAGPTVWQGVIDRLYRVGDDWVLEDYKTDREERPDRYHFQLGVYWRAVRLVRGVAPRVQLVYLRSGNVVRVPAEALEAALAEQAVA